MINDSKVTNQINFIKRKYQAKITKSKILVKSKNHDFFPNFRNIEVGPGFFTSKAKLIFTMLKQIFVKTSILHHFDLEYYI